MNAMLLVEEVVDAIEEDMDAVHTASKKNGKKGTSERKFKRVQKFDRTHAYVRPELEEKEDE
jgi:hypothetical protein